MTTTPKVIKLTQRQADALEILEKFPKIDARAFAQKFWGHLKETESGNMFTAHSNGGNGVQKGKKAWLMAGSYIGKLKKKKLASHYMGEAEYFCNEYSITTAGKEALAQYRKDHERKNT